MPSAMGSFWERAGGLWLDDHYKSILLKIAKDGSKRLID
jgi:hypothetical protein